jgi:hypothetical protein
MKSILGIIILILEIIAIIDVIKSFKDTGKKVLWIVLIVLLPVIGLILYYLTVGSKRFLSRTDFQLESFLRLDNEKGFCYMKLTP